jgi:GDP-mannose 6-dehydrogenase
MRKSLFGMGYVGTVSAASLADRGHSLIGVDTDQTKFDLLQVGRSPIVEQQIDELIAQGYESGKLTATTDVQTAVDQSEVSFVCVGTPSQVNGSLDLTHVERACRQIGAAIAKKGERHHIVIRNTMLPWSMDSVVLPALSETAGHLGEDFGLCVNPVFLRKGSAV